MVRARVRVGDDGVDPGFDLDPSLDVDLDCGFDLDLVPSQGAYL